MQVLLKINTIHFPIMLSTELRLCVVLFEANSFCVCVFLMLECKVFWFINHYCYLLLLFLT